MKTNILLKNILLGIMLVSIASVEAGLQDRAFATHNVGQIGYFTTNIGQYYPYGGQFEKTMEYPINSGHISIYRQCIMVGVPTNVISAADGRFEEWDALGGFDAGNAEIAISDNPSTWPAGGWPVKDEAGEDWILSQQETFCAYSDSTNWRYANSDPNGPDNEFLLDLKVYQTIHSWGLPEADRFLVLRFELQNDSPDLMEDVYFNFYSDLDIGGNDNAAREWADDCIAFDKNRELIYFYDADNYSDEWGEADPFLNGITFLETPNHLGITDWHWIDVTVDEVAVNSAFWDSVSFNLMRSDTSFFHEHPLLQVSDFFHLGDNPSNGTHYDDPNTTRIEDESGNVVGGAMVAYIVNGPFEIPAGESVEILVGVMVGDNEADLLQNVDNLWSHHLDDYARLVPPPQPSLSYDQGNNNVTLYWSNELDMNAPTTGIEGYILYRTSDPSLMDWTVLDTIPLEFSGSSNLDTMAYSYEDYDVLNGFLYYYNLTSYRMADGLVQESVRLADIENIDNQSGSQVIKPQTKASLNESDLDDIKVVPNPYIISAEWDNHRLGNTPFGEPIRNLAFTNLPSPCTIHIYTVDGDRLQTLEHAENTGRLEWNLLTSERRAIVSGIYFYHIESDLGDKVGRFALVR